MKHLIKLSLIAAVLLSSSICAMETTKENDNPEIQRFVAKKQEIQKGLEEVKRIQDEEKKFQHDLDEYFYQALGHKSSAICKEIFENGLTPSRDPMTCALLDIARGGILPSQFSDNRLAFLMEDSSIPANYRPSKSEMEEAIQTAAANIKFFKDQGKEDPTHQKFIDMLQPYLTKIIEEENTEKAVNLETVGETTIMEPTYYQGGCLPYLNRAMDSLKELIQRATIRN